MLRVSALAVLLFGCGSRTGLSAASGGSLACSSAPMFVLVTGPTADAHEQIVAFDPATATFGSQVTVPCLGPGPPLPTVFAVDAAGKAFIAGSSIDTHLFGVDIATGACESTGFQPSYTGFGLAFVEDPGSPGPPRETLYAVEASDRLVQLDTRNFTETTVGTLDPGHLAVLAPTLGAPVLLAGDAAGDLFRFDTEIPAPPPPPGPPSPPGAPSGKTDGGVRGPPAATTSGTIWRVNRQTAAETAAWSLPPRSTGSALGSNGFARWGSDFYFFEPAAALNAGGEGTAVWRFRPADGSLSLAAQTGFVVLSAGAPPCASP